MSTPRGARRHEALLAAAASLLESEGFGVVSHRRVAAHAGLPLAATTYYFDSLEDLVGQALDRVASAHLDAARELLAVTEVDGPADAAEVLVDIAVGPGADEPNRLLALYERYLEGARHLAFRGRIQGWNVELIALVGDLLHRAGLPSSDPTPRLVLALVDGIVIDRLVGGGERPLDGVRRDLAAALVWLGAGAGWVAPPQR